MTTSTTPYRASSFLTYTPDRLAECVQQARQELAEGWNFNVEDPEAIKVHFIAARTLGQIQRDFARNIDSVVNTMQKSNPTEAANTIAPGLVNSLSKEGMYTVAEDLGVSFPLSDAEAHSGPASASSHPNASDAASIDEHSARTKTVTTELEGVIGKKGEEHKDMQMLGMQLQGYFFQKHLEDLGNSASLVKSIASIVQANISTQDLNDYFMFEGSECSNSVAHSSASVGLAIGEIVQSVVIAEISKNPLALGGFMALEQRAADMFGSVG